MGKYSRVFIFALGIIFVSGLAQAEEKFTFEFEWGDIPVCNTGSPTMVPNPIFTFNNFPEGTKQIKFQMTDLSANYDHGTAIIDYTGQTELQPGAFEYESPCPSNGSHLYEWYIWAKDDSGQTLAKSLKRKPYGGS